MAARRGDLERALSDFLALDLRKVGPGVGDLGFRRGRRRQQGGAFEVSEQRQQVGRGEDLELSRPARLAALHRRADQPLVFARGMKRGEQHPGRGGDSPVEAQLPDRDIMRQRFRVGRSDRGQQAQGDRQVEMRSLLGQIGRGQVDGDPLGRERQADRGKRSADPFAAFRDRLVGKADDDESGQPGRQLHLHFDGAGLKPEVSDGGDGRGHLRPHPLIQPCGNTQQSP